MVDKEIDVEDCKKAENRLLDLLAQIKEVNEDWLDGYVFLFQHHSEVTDCQGSEISACNCNEPLDDLETKLEELRIKNYISTFRHRLNP